MLSILQPQPPLPENSSPPLSPRVKSLSPPELPKKPQRPVPSPVPSNQSEQNNDN